MSEKLKKNKIRILTYLAIYLVSFMFVSGNIAELERESKAQVISSLIQQDNLELTAKKLTELYENKKCKEFFNTFPNAFREFNQLYGFDDEKGARILYSKSEHITYFFNCSEITGREKLKKVIGIGIGGKWDADNINLFQDSAFDLIKAHSAEAKEILNNLPDEKASSFWHFLLDGPHPNDREKVKEIDLLSDLLGKESKQRKLLLKQYFLVLLDWENH